jgi:hypothetical protein
MSTGTRLLHQSGFRRGPLSRPIDRTEAWTRLALCIVFLALALPASWYVADRVSAAGLQQENAQLAGRHQVVARLLADTSGSDSRVGMLTVQVPVSAEWTEADGTRHQGVIRVVPGSQAGSTQTIWTDADGRPTSAPQSRADTAASVTGAVFLVAIVTAGLLTVAGSVTHKRFEQRRCRQWEAEWERVGPDWTRHR